jgi:hypothetical protein
MRHELLKRTPFWDDYREIILQLAELNPVAADKFCDAVEERRSTFCPSTRRSAPRLAFHKHPTYGSGRSVDIPISCSFIA